MDELRYRQISAEELARGDGKEGRPALVAYKGRVYDVTVSKLWRNGKHVNAHMAGTDLTREMAAAPHMEDVMAAFPVIGLYPDPTAEDRPAGESTSAAVGTTHQGAVVQAASTTSAAPGSVAAISTEAAEASAGALNDILLKNHAHPVSVHWPIALGFVAACLTLLELLWPHIKPLKMLGHDLGISMYGNQHFDPPLSISWRYLIQQVSLVNVIICALFSIPAIYTGWLSWKHNYASSDKPVYRAKIVWSWVLGILIVLTLGVRYLMPGAGALDGGLWYWVYSLLVIAHGPVVIILGHYGGKIMYPH